MTFFILTFFLSVVMLFAVVKCRQRDLFECVKSIPLLGWLIAYNFPPSDYCTPVVRIPVDCGESKVNVVFPYTGRYDVHIVNIWSNVVANADVSIELVIGDKHNDRVVWRMLKDKPMLLVYESMDGVNGFRYWYDAFVVPKDIPVNIPLCMSIMCHGNVEGLLRNHPNAVIEVRKSFDK